MTLTTMAGDGERRWKLGGRVTQAGHHDCSFVRDLSEVEVNELREKFRAIHELAEQRGMTRVLEFGNRWGALLDAVQEEIELDGAISAQSQKAAQLELAVVPRSLYGSSTCDGLARPPRKAGAVAHGDAQAKRPILLPHGWVAAGGGQELPRR